MSKTPRLPSTQLHGELQGVWLLSTPTLQLSRVYLPSTCDITHVITYTRPSSLLFYFWVRGRGRPGDEAIYFASPGYMFMWFHPEFDFKSICSSSVHKQSYMALTLCAGVSPLPTEHLAATWSVSWECTGFCRIFATELED